MPAAIVPAVSTAGSLVGAVGGKNAQNQAKNAANQAAGAQSQLLGAEAQSIDGITNSYFGQGGANQGMNRLMQYLSGTLGQTYSSPYTSSAASTASGLQNFQGLKPQEMAALQTNLGNSGQSTVNTLLSRLGGTANPNALAQDLFTQNNQNALNSTVQLGNLGAQQELGAQQSAGQLYSGLSGQNLSYQLGNQTDLNSLYGTQAGLLGSALSGQSNIAQQYGLAGAQAAQNASSYGNPWANALTSLGGLAGSSGVFGNASSAGSTNYFNPQVQAPTIPSVTPGVGGYASNPGATSF
jgi:hypothetical protein